MKNVFAPGDEKEYRVVVSENDIASFHGEQVHPVCSTFTLAREIEWSTRLFVLEVIEPEEEGIGTMINIEHLGPAYVGEQLHIISRVRSFIENELICDYTVKVGDRTIARGETGQKIIKKETIKRIFTGGRDKE